MINFGNIPGLLLLGVLFGLLLTAVRLVNARLGLEVGMAFALLTGFLINPHSLLYDWGIAFVAIYLIRLATLTPPHLADFWAGLLVISLFAAGQLAWYGVSETYETSSLAVNPVTVWAILMNVGILALTARVILKERRRQALAPATTPASS
jgi:hypothetical protein